MKKETATKAAKPAAKHTKTASKSVERKSLQKTRGGATGAVSNIPWAKMIPTYEKDKG